VPFVASPLARGIVHSNEVDTAPRGVSLLKNQRMILPTQRTKRLCAACQQTLSHTHNAHAHAYTVLLSTRNRRLC
jgi:hypothetical protein